MSAHVVKFGARSEDQEAADRQEIVDTLSRHVREEGDLKHFAGNFKIAHDLRIWETERRFHSGSVIPACSYYDFIHKPYAEGIGATYELVERLIADDAEALSLHTRAKGSRQGERSDLVDNINEVQHERPTGTSKEAGLRRLEKEAAAGSDIAARALAAVKEGRLSVHAGCVEAGVRKSTKIDRDVRDRAAQALAERIVANFPADELDAAKADAFASGSRALGIALANLTGECLMDRGHG